jgi:hypothetical protein
MKKYTQVRKKLIIGLITVSLSMTLMPITGSLLTEKELSMKVMSCSDGIIISGWMGENGWYKSGVVLTLNVTGPINHTYFKIDDGDWIEYTMPVLVVGDGYHTACFYYTDLWGQIHMYNASFKIDTTLPEITLTKETVGLGQIQFVANVSDAMSGVWRVEFYIDDELVFTDFDAPFESDVFWSGNHNVLAFVFDFAGQSDAADLITPYVLGNVGMNCNPTEKSATTINCFQESLNERECSSVGENITVTFTYPENGIYWNDRKIMPYSVPFILHGNGDLSFNWFRFYRDTPVEYTITGLIDRVDFYLDGALIGSATAPPYEFDFPIPMPSFSHINVKIIAYGGNQGDWGSDEITIWRLFV